jgi:hypothetical protein
LVHGAVSPAESEDGAGGPGCPAFGDSVLERPDRETPGRDNVHPGLHAFGADGAGYGVVWWDPRRLGLDVQPVYGLRREDLIQTRPETVTDRPCYEAGPLPPGGAERGARPAPHATDRAAPRRRRSSRAVTLVTDTGRSQPGARGSDACRGAGDGRARPGL